jgi:hypothetical protein
MVFSWQHNRLHSVLLLVKKDELDVTMLSHCLNDAQIVLINKENAWPEVFLEQEPSKVFFSSVVSDVWRLLFSCTVRVIKLFCLLKDLNNLTRSFWFLIAALWRNALSAVSHCTTSTALSECWDSCKSVHFDLTSVQPQCMSALYATDSLSLWQNWEDSWWSTFMRYSKKQFSDVSIMHSWFSSETAWCIESLLCSRKSFQTSDETLSLCCIQSWDASVLSSQYRCSNTLSKCFSSTSLCWVVLCRSLDEGYELSVLQYKRSIISLQIRRVINKQLVSSWLCSTWIFLWTDARWHFFKSRFLFFSVCFNSLFKPCIVDAESLVSHCIVCDESAEDEFSSRRSSNSAQL